MYVTDGGHNVVWLYAPHVTPTVGRESSSAVTQTHVEVTATIDPGNANTAYQFEYGTSASYGASVPVPDGDIAASAGPTAVAQELTGLQPGTTYHYRVVATNEFGQAVGGDQTFTTPPVQPPVVSTGQATGVAQNTATLTGTIDTQGFATVYEFDIGVDTSYGTRIFGDAGTEQGQLACTASLQGLASSTTYHYRIVATNTFGTVYGVDETFTTSAYPTAVLSEPVAPPLVPTSLLAPAPPASTSKGAKAASIKAVGHESRRLGHQSLRSSKQKPKPKKAKRKGGGKK